MGNLSSNNFGRLKKKKVLLNQRWRPEDTYNSYTVVLIYIGVNPWYIFDSDPYLNSKYAVTGEMSWGGLQSHVIYFVHDSLYP